MILYYLVTKCSVAESELTENGYYERIDVKCLLTTGIGYFIKRFNFYI